MLNGPPGNYVPVLGGRFGTHSSGSNWGAFRSVSLAGRRIKNQQVWTRY